jgi:hypothetical protein
VNGLREARDPGGDRVHADRLRDLEALLRRHDPRRRIRPRCVEVVRADAQASDVMTDGTNEPGQTCDGISLGLGFDAVAVHLGQVWSEPPRPQPCVDAGGG